MKTRRPILAVLAVLAFCGSLWIATTRQAKEVKAEPVSGYHVPKIIDFACGKNHTLAIDSNGRLWQWGINSLHGTPTIIMPNKTFVQVRAGSAASAALTSDGDLYFWKNYETPSLCASNVKTFGIKGTAVHYYQDSTATLMDSSGSYGSLFSYWKPNGDLMEASSSRAAKVKSYGKIPAVAAVHDYDYDQSGVFSGGSYHGCVSVLYFDGAQLQFEFFHGSYSYSSRLEGNIPYNYGLTTSFLSSADLSSFTNSSIIDACFAFASDKSAAKTAFVITGNGELFGFGDNGLYNLFGSNDSTSVTSSMTPIKASCSAVFKKVRAGLEHVIALGNDGKLYSWGSNQYGQLGQLSDCVVPTEIPFFQSNSQYSFIATKGETYEGSFALEGMNSYTVDTDPSKGDVVLNASTGAFSYTPDANATGTDYFTVEVSDGVVTKTYIVNVTIDYKPVWQSFETSFNVRRGESFSSSAPAMDGDGDLLKYAVVQYPTQGTVEIGETSGAFTYTANDNGAGNDSFKIAVTDGYFTIEKTISVHVETFVVVEDTYERSFDATSTDVHFASQLVATDDDGDALSWSVIKAPALGTLDLNTSTGAYTYDSDQGVTGNDSFIIQVTDGVYPIQKEYTIHLYSVKDNGTSLVNVTTTGVPFSSQILTEAKNTAVSYSIKTQGSFGVTTINAESGEYTYTPNADTRGQDSFVVTVSHTYGSYELEVFIYQNSIPNDSLVNTSIIVAESGSYSGSVACTDLDLGDTLSYQLQANPMKGNVDLNVTTGAYTYTPLERLAGDDSFAVKVSDGFNEITITVDVHIESAIQTESNVYHTTSQSMAIQGVLTATDKDGDTLSYSLKTSATNGASSVSADGTYSYTPDADFYGDDSFVAIVTDGVAPVDITIHVHVNRKPIVEDDVVSVVAKGSSITGSVSASDPDDDALTYSIYLEPEFGTASVDSANGKFSYTPNEGAAGDDSFVIKADDGVDYALITVNVHNETELVIDTSNTNLVASQGKTLNGSVAATDADGDTLSYSIATEPSKGTLEINANTGAWAYHCNDDASGNDSFEIAVTDGVKEKKVTFHLSINIPPVSSSESVLSFSTNQNSPFIGNVVGADHDGDALTYSVVSQGSKGTVTINESTGQYRYTPNEGAAGDDQFVLGILDGVFLTEVVVNAHIETDIVVQESIVNVTVAKGQAVDGAIHASDADGDALVFSISEQGKKGYATVNSGGAWSYSANGEGAGSDSFVIAISDGIHTKYVTVSVRIDSLPTFDVDSVTIEASPNGQATGKATATDLDGDELFYSVSTGPSHGTASINSRTGEYVYTNTDSASSDSFTILVTDSHGNSASFIVNVKINTAPSVQNEAPRYQVNQGGSCSGTISASDMEGDSLTFAIAEGPKFGTVQLDSKTGDFNYKANAFASGDTDSFVVEVSDGFNTTRVLVQMKIDSTAMNVGFVAGGVVAYTAVVVAAVLIIGKLRKKGQ